MSEPTAATGVPEIVAILEKLNDYIEERTKLEGAYSRYRALEVGIRGLNEQLSKALYYSKTGDPEFTRVLYATTVMRLKEKLGAATPSP